MQIECKIKTQASIFSNIDTKALCDQKANHLKSPNMVNLHKERDLCV